MMELQWPLVLFVVFTAWSAGLFGTQALVSLKGENGKSQMVSLITSVVLLAVGGIAVFFHLQHFERILNGFGHLTSGITQELIAIVVVVLVMVIYFAMLRQSGEKCEIPKWLAILSVILSVVLCIVCGHSYTMPSRPAWDSVFQILSLVGAACILGPATFAVIVSFVGKEEGRQLGAMGAMCFVYGAILAAVLEIAYIAAMCFTEFTSFDATYFDPTQPTKDITVNSVVNPFNDNAMGLTIAVIVLAIAAAVFAAFGKKKGDYKMAAPIALVCGLIAAICLRVIFYVLGVSVYQFY